MTSTFHSSLPPFTIDLNQDHQHRYFCSKSTTEDASPSSSISYPIFLSPLNSHEEVQYFRTELQPLHHREGNIYGGSWNDHTPTLVKENKNSQILSFPNKEEKSKSIMSVDHLSENGSMKWMSSKVRLMKKMVPSDHPKETSIHKFGDVKARSSPLQDDNITKNLSIDSNNTIRVCADCNTTKTPLWRSGPRGPKSLCNACGIRQRKARRALAAAQASANGTTFPTDHKSAANNKVHNQKIKTSHLPFKKRCKFTTQSRGNYRKKQMCFDDLSSIILSTNSAFQQLFPQDEKEGAILLMALSYGMVHG